MKTRIIISLFAMTFLWSCATSMKYTWTKDDYQGKKFNKILVIVEAQTQEGRTAGENAIVERLNKEGITATNSLAVFPQMANNGTLSEDEIEARIKDGGYDGVLITSLIDVSTKEVQEMGTSYYPAYGYRYGRHVRSGYMHMQEPDYYRQQKTFVLETQFFDVTTEATKKSVVWSGQSSLTDPSTDESASKTYSKTLVKTLIESGTIE